MSNLIDKKIQQCKENNRAAFVAYITAGDPDYDTSAKVIDTLVDSGVDIIEMGVPFSDPLADGEANQLAAERALESGMTPLKVLALAEYAKSKYPDVPIVLFTYLNPIAYSGDFAEYCAKAATSGVDAILPLDLPPEEDPSYRKTISDAGLSVVSLIAPTTTEDRVKALAENATGFIYYVCQEGVTGERKEFASGVDEKVAVIKKYAECPVVVGFGISTPEHVKAAASTGVDGVVVGSAIVRKVEALSKGNAALEDIGDFVKSLTGALK